MATPVLTYSATTFAEATANDGSISTSITITLADDTFAADLTDKIVATNLPTGLTATFVRTSGTVVTATLTGTASSHANTNDIANLTFTFQDGAFVTTATAADVTGYAKSDLVIDFADPVTPPAAGTLAITALADTDGIGNVWPALTGTATSGTADVHVFNGTKDLGKATVASDGTWSFAVPASVKDGKASFTVKELTGKAFGSASPAVVYTLDSKAPAAPTVNAIKLPTKDTTPELSGKAEKDAMVEVFADGVSVGSVKASSAGVWKLDTSALAEKVHAITAKATDAAGNVSAASKAVNLTVDTSIAQPTITTDIAPSSKVATQKLEGKAEAGAKVQIYGGTAGTKELLAKPVVADKNGVWKASIKLEDVAHKLTVKATDVAGNESVASAEKAVTIDTKAPDAPTVDAATVTTAAKALPTTITGKAENGASVEVFAGSISLGKTTADASTGVWTITPVPAKELKDGVQKITAKATDAAGNASKASAAVNYTIDNKGPAAPTVNAIKLPTKDTTPTLTGKAEKDATVEVFAGTTSLGTVKADAKGVWTLTVKTGEELAEGTYAITATAKDAAGNTSGATTKPVTLSVDLTSTLPTIKTDILAITKVATQKLEGTAEAGAKVQIYGDTAGTKALLAKPVVADKNGVWKASVKLADGEYKINVIATDVAGNVSTKTADQVVTIDTATTVPTLELVKTGTVLTGLKGTAEALATVKITVGTVKDKFTATADASGKWEVTNLSAFTVTKESKLKITAIATDTATNVSKASTAVEHTFKVGETVPADTTAPAFVSAVTNFAGTKVILTYSEDLGGTAPDKGAFAVLSGASGSETANTVTGVAVSGSRVTLTLTTPIVAGQSIKVAYEAPAVVAGTSNAAIQDRAGNDAATLATTTATNKVSNASLADQANEFSNIDTNIGTPLSNNSSLATNYKWASGNVTYSFNTSAPSEYAGVSNSATSSGNLTSGWSALNATEKTVVQEAFTKLASLLPVTFTEVAGNTGDIRFNAVPTKSSTSGFAYYPGTSPSYAGDVFLSTNDRSENYGAGSHNYYTVIHEIGHAMGLKHPFENPDILTTSLDNYAYTVMSYTNSKNGLATFTYNAGSYSYSYIDDAKPASWSILDIAAMQSMYGANTNYKTENNTYNVSFSDKSYLTIWDAGGVDSINAAAADGACMVDLRPGTLSSFDVHTIAMQTAATQAYYQQSMGNTGASNWVTQAYATPWFTTNLFTGENNVGIANGVWIENVTTGSAADTVRDNAVNNMISTGAGDDIIRLFEGGFDTVDGGSGTDTVFVNDAWADIQTEKQPDGSYLIVGSYFAAQLIGVEILSYAGGTHTLT